MGKRKEKKPQVPRRRITAKLDLLPGASPGTLTPLAGSAAAEVHALTIEDDRSVTVKHQISVDHLPPPAKKGLQWVRVIGFGEVEPLTAIADFYGIRRLALEDTLSRGWRTKMEEQGEFVFFLLHAPPGEAAKGRNDHLALFCKPGLVITFEDSATELVDSIWERLKKEPIVSKITHLAEFATYMMLDLIVDSFFPHLDRNDEILAELEESVSEHLPTRQDLNRLHQVKRTLITLRRLLSPYKEIRMELAKYHSLDAARELRPFFSDLGDHIVQAWELLDTYFDVARSLDDIFQTMISNRMNDIIKILTIISTVFMPLTFIAGVYGMNFDNMPEIGWSYGYPLTLAVMAVIALAMIWLFKKKNWL